VKTFNDISILVLIGFFFTFLVILVIGICLFTIRKVKNVYDYCSEQFAKMEELIQASNKNMEKIKDILEK
jgi:hypothetical protein